MPNVNLIVGNDGSNALQGTSGNDLIYGFSPNGPQSQVSSIAATRVATGLTQPLFAVAPPGDFDRLFLVEKTGRIKILDLDTGQVLATAFLDVSGQITTASESGLLGLAFHPNFAQNGFFYVNLINTSGDTEIRRYQVSADPNQADAGSSTLVLTIDQPAGFGNHKAGWLDFGPDGYLYAALGDGGGAGDPFGNGQNINTLLGKILRLDVNSDAFPGDATRNYALPADNPFVGTAGADEIWAFGLRNPWRSSFDRGLGDLYIADVGQGQWEEINLGQIGANYGWNVYEGPAVFAGGTPTGGSAVPPIYYYDHGVGRSITGGYVYRGESEGLQGQYFFADFTNGRIFTLSFNGASWTAVERTSQISANIGAINNPSSFGEDALGNLYVVDFDGDIFRLTPIVSSADQGDVVSGLGGDDMLFGGSGDDTLDGGAGADFLYGGPGTDTASYGSALAGVSLDLLTGVGTGDAQGDIFSSIESFLGSSFNDTLQGNAGANVLSGGAGNDTIRGLGGNDTLAGGNGADQFVLSAPSDGVDTIVDFVAGADLLALSRTGFGLSASGSLAAAGVSFVYGQGPSAAGPTIVLNFSDDFSWDPDGTGAAPAVQLVHVNGASAGHATVGNPGSSGWSPIAMGDLNNDGTGDVLWRHDNGTTAAWLMNGGQVASSPNYGSSAGWNVIATGDFNNNGTDDILWRHANGTTAAWSMNNGAITGTPAFGSTTGWNVLASGDFNNDGTDDILWRHDNGTTAAWLMNGGGIGSTPFYGSSTGWNVIGSGDFDNNGTDDILWRHDNGTTAAWLMNNGAMSSTPFYGSTTGWNLIGSGDFNNNGTADLLWRHADGTTAAWLMSNGTMSSTPFYGSTAGWNVAAIGDFNDDGKDDILWQQSGSGTTAAWLMQGGQIGGTIFYESTSGFGVVGTANFDGNGTDDLLWRRPSDGAAGTWLFDHLTAQSWLVV